MSVRHQAVKMQLSTGPEWVYLLEGPHITYMGSIYGVFSSWELLLEHVESGCNVSIGMISERFLTAEDRETGRMHAALLESLFVLPPEE
jgi:hypothetical protein